MKSYNIYRDAAGTTVAVKQGWSWPAFLFVSFWAMSKRLWVVAFVTLPLFLLVYALAAGSTQPQAAGEPRMADQMLGIWLIAKVLVGAMGNQWRAKQLAGRGFEVIGSVSAPDSKRALALQTTQS